MKKIKEILTFCSLFLLASSVVFLLQWLGNFYQVFATSLEVHWWIFIITFVIIIALVVLFFNGLKDKIGFIFLFFLLFKMFAMAFLAFYNEEFKLNLVSSFVIYWIYLVLEVVVIISLLKRYDKSLE